MTRIKQVARKTENAPSKVARLGRSAALKKVSTAKSDTTKERKKRRWHPGTVATRLFFRYQKAVAKGDMLVQKTPFQRLVKEIIQSRKPDTQLTLDALKRSQEAAQVYSYDVLNMAGSNARFYGRQTLRVQDIDRALNLLKPI